MTLSLMLLSTGISGIVCVVRKLNVGYAILAAAATVAEPDGIRVAVPQRLRRR